MGGSDSNGAQAQSEVRMISTRSPTYKLEYVNGALCNNTARGEIVCNFHFEFKDQPTEQTASLFDDGTAKLNPMQESRSFTREVKFGIIMDPSFAESLVEVLNGKITEGKEIIAARETERKARAQT